MNKRVTPADIKRVAEQLRDEMTAFGKGPRILPMAMDVLANYPTLCARFAALLIPAAPATDEGECR